MAQEPPSLALHSRFARALGVDKIAKAVANAFIYVAKHELATFAGLLNLIGGGLFFIIGIAALLIDFGRTSLGVVLSCIAFPCYWLLCVSLAGREAERTQRGRGGSGRGR